MPDPTATSTARRYRLRRALLATLFVLALLLVLLGALLAWHPAVFLRAGLRLAGHEEISFDHLQVGLRRLELTGLALGGRTRPEQLVGRVTVDYRPGDLLRGRIEAVSVQGVTLRGRVDQDGLRLEGLDLASGGAGEPARLPPLPLPERVSIRDVRLELTTPAGIVTIPVEAELRPERDRATFVVDAPGGGGKRDAHSFEHYNRTTGISVYASPAVHPGELYLYFDPVEALSADAQARWRDPAEQEAMISDALKAARST